MATVVELRPRVRQEFTSSLGMIVFLASWAMMFAGLFFAYGFIRTKAVVWPPVGTPRLSLTLPAINTVVLGASSWSFARGLEAVRRGRQGPFRAMVAATLGLGALFLALQIAVFRDAAAAGLTITNGLYGGVFWAFTAVHAAHVAVGLGIVLWLLVQAVRGRCTEHDAVNVRLCSMYWHFVGVVWALMFLTIYVL
jgi:heme/copper-type cytochrome/quinol oxidase subunit 3